MHCDSHFPDLKGYITRLFDSTVEIIDQRVENIDQQVEGIVPLFFQFKEISKQIDCLEFVIYDKSILSRIYRLFQARTMVAQLEDAEKKAIKFLNTCSRKVNSILKKLNGLRKEANSMQTL